MIQYEPTKSDYLAIVSEWSSQTRNGGLVGNAYPILNLMEERVVSEPRNEFTNPGAVFLMNRVGFGTWDFVRLRPRENTTYKDKDDRDCFYIPALHPLLIQYADELNTVATVLHHPSFDPSANTRQLQNPSHNVTPIFFIRKFETYYGPLLRDGYQLSATDDMQRIDWRPIDDDGIIYEFTQAQLQNQGLKFAQYEHPTPAFNRILEHPITLAIGKIRAVRSTKAHDTLPLQAVIEWYINHCPSELITPEIAAGLRTTFKGDTIDSPVIVNARLKKIEGVMATHAAFSDQRDRFARDYLKTAPGRQQLQETLELTVKKKAAEIQAEVDRQEGELANRRDELALQLANAETEHQQFLEQVEVKRVEASAGLEQLKAASQELRSTLTQDANELASKLREQIPLLAALSGGARIESSTEVREAKITRIDFKPLTPTKPLQPVTDERKLVEDLRVDLVRQGLSFAREFVANIYVSMKAESLNLIIGPPGYGKSMLVTTMARSLGHAEAFLPITVRRSWSEDRFLLGFYDTFNKRYDPGATQLVPRMIRAEADWKADKRGVYIVLLDEFNLAAPEYYFAQLLQTLPSDDTARSISLYDPTSSQGDGFPHKVAIGPNIRFWGTINYDETTERLSPRTLDRTGMIFLGESDVHPVPETESIPMPGVAAKDIFEKYRRTHTECPDEHWETVSKVINELRILDVGIGPKIELSPRVQNAIRRYLANSQGVLDPKVAVDFVVQQRILPVVRGRGDEFLARIRRLAELLAKLSLNRSARHVEETLKRADSMFGEVDFLSY